MLAKIAVVAMLILTMWFEGCDFMKHTRCNDEILRSEKSPDGRFMAIAFARSCANNTGHYTWVALKEGSSITGGESELEPVLTIEGTHDIKLNWRTPNNLQIESSGLQNKKEVITQRDAWEKVTITYAN